MRNRKSNVDVVRAWKDPTYRATLSTEELARIPASPVGLSELDPNVLGEVGGAVKERCPYPKEPSTRFRCTKGQKCRCPQGG